MTALDDAIYEKTPSYYPAEWMTEIRAARYRAHNIVFDREASDIVGRFSRECTDLVLDNVDFALPPFEDTYVELDYIGILENSSRPVHEDTADKIGFLITRDNKIYVVICGQTHASFNVMRYVRTYDYSGTDKTSFYKNDVAIRSFLIGETNSGTDVYYSDKARHLADIWNVEFAPEARRSKIEQMLFQEFAGEIKFLVTALLFINQKKSTFVSQPHTKRIKKGKIRTYLAHNVITIHLTSKEPKRWFGVGDRSSPRRHAVKAHYVHYGIDEQCIHDWNRYEKPDQRLRWKCNCCKGLRIRKESHHRGDASIGYVKSQYEVKV